MRSGGRLTYGGVARALGLTDEGPQQPGAESRLPMLKTLHMISRRLRAIRTRRGALEFQLPEAKVLLGPDGEPTDVVRSRGDAGVKQAYELVEDLMLLANEVVAEDLTRRALPAIYRVHGKPDAKKVATFAAVAEAFGHALEEGAEESPRKLQQFLLKVADTEHASSLGFLLLRAMQQASYDIANIGHFALAARDYLHFTSPIRRYPDLAVHRVVRSLARGEHIDVESLRTRLQLQARQSSRMERRAMTVERETVSLYRCILLKDRVGEEFDGSITGVTENGLSVSLDQPFVDVRVPVERLGDDYYEIDRLGIRLAGRRTGHGFSLGQRVRLRLESVNVERREVVAVPTSLPEARRKRGSEPARARTRDERAMGAGKEPRSHHDAPRGRQAPLRDGQRRAEDARPRGARPAATRTGGAGRSAGPSRGTHPRDMPLSPTKKDGKNRRSR
jgi:ribonuclease R